MRISHWLMVAGLVAPLFACSTSDDSGDGGSGGGTGGGVVGGSGGGVVGGSGGGVVGGSGGGTSDCPAGTTQIEVGGQCACAIPCTMGDDSPCQGQGHCCDFSAMGEGNLCGADNQAACDSVLAMECGSGGSGGSTGFNCAALTNGQAPECDTCAATNCTAQCTSCTNNSDCLSIFQCAVECTDLPCIQACESQYPNGTADFESFLGQPGGCLITSCQSTCFSG